MLLIEVDLILILNQIAELRSLVFTKEYGIRKQGYLKGEIPQTLAGEIISAIELMKSFSSFYLPENHKEIELELARFGKKLINFFDYALSIYEGKKKNEGFIDYEDILLHTKLLLENKDVQKSLSEKYNFIMVDEFQDTNEIQYQIFLPILDYLKGGKLFIVGDEKQSIYKFRDAEIEIFNLTRID